MSGEKRIYGPVEDRAGTLIPNAAFTLRYKGDVAGAAVLRVPRPITFSTDADGECEFFAAPGRYQALLVIEGDWPPYKFEVEIRPDRAEWLFADCVPQDMAPEATTPQLLAAIAARDDAQAARATTETARDQTLAARDTAQGHRDAAAASASAAGQDRDTTEAARDATLAARDTAEGHRDAAAASATGAAQDRDTTETARDQTLAARDTTLGHRDAAAASAGAAAQDRATTETARDAALAARDTALGHRDAAAASAQTSTAAAQDASQFRDEASDAATAASLSADRVDLGELDDAVASAQGDAAAAAVSATDAAESAVNSEVSRAGAAASASAAQLARDAAFVNAETFADIATGRAAVADGEQFQVVDGDEIVRYRRDSSTTQTELARYPAAQSVDTIVVALWALSAVLGQSNREVQRLSAEQEGDAYTRNTLLEALSVISQLSDQINGGQIALRGGTLADPALRIGTVGVYSSAANTLSIEIAGSEVARFTASGLTVYGTVTEA